MRYFIFPVGIMLGVFSLVSHALTPPSEFENETSSVPNQTRAKSNEADEKKVSTQVDLLPIVLEVNKHFEQAWNDKNLQPVEKTHEIEIYRRLALSLLGTIPSLEEIREFESDSKPNKLTRWTNRLLDDKRFANYYAERFARVWVGTEEGAFLIYRRDLFTRWVSEQLESNRPYNKLVQELLTKQGLWTGDPATNFITAAVSNDEIDQFKLAGRTVRAFLGQRIDCAQCHDHPFDKWTQDEYEKLVAFFAPAEIQFSGLRDNEELAFSIPAEEGEKDEERTIAAAVPFHSEWVPSKKAKRLQLASWVTHPENRRFERAIVNRMWGYLFGKPYYSPVDNLPDPSDELDVLDLLGKDFREHNYDLKHLIRTIVQTRVFQLSSQVNVEVESSVRLDLEEAWAVFPVSRLRPEQMLGAMFQSSSVTTVDQDSHWVFRTLRLLNEIEFVQEYGDLGEEELTAVPGTVSQTLLMMNGYMANNLLEPNLLNSSSSIAEFSASPRECIENCFLITLTRYPTDAEKEHFLAQFETVEEEEDYSRVVEDLLWSLFNSPEFNYSH